MVEYLFVPVIILIFWHALIGALALLAQFYGIGGALYECIRNANWNHRRRRYKWLVQHFGEMGAERWLVNEKLVPIYLDWYRYGNSAEVVKKMQKARDRYGARCFDPIKMFEDGTCRGFIFDGMRWNDHHAYKFKGLVDDTPWSHALYSRYVKQHADSELRHEPLGSISHGEPRGCDWLAAGFWGLVQLDDGQVVDPMRVLFHDMVTSYLKNSEPNDVLQDGESMHQATRIVARNYFEDFDMELARGIDVKLGRYDYRLALQKYSKRVFPVY